MAYYIILSKLTDEGRRTIKQKPERILEVNKELGKMGVNDERAICCIRSILCCVYRCGSG